MTQPAVDSPAPALSRTAFIVVWTLASVVPWITTTLLWRIQYEVAYGADSDVAEAERLDRTMHIVVWLLGIALSVLIEARLLRQFRDDTRWWWILGIGVALVMEPFYALVPAPTADTPIVDWAMGVRVAGHLLWAVLTWRLIRLWGWRDRYWLGFNIVVALALPLVDRLGESVAFWTKVLIAQAGVRDLAALYVLGNLSSGLIGAVIVSAPMALLLWQHVVVHRRGIAPLPAR